MDPHDRWFVEQVLPLEGALSAYLRRVWPDPAEVDDLRQEVYVRVYKGAQRKRPPATNHYVFAVARNLLVDRLRHRRVVHIDLVADLESLNVLSNELPPDRVLSGRQELARLERAMSDLPDRCREAFVLRKIEGHSQREAAQLMGVSQTTIEKHIGKAMRILASSFFGNGETQASADEKDDGECDENRSAN
ncbi:RNA polymerase sigma factor [Pelagerythrobacter aerophilus]|uniref:RNA polymerase sigma factor n=1 Tax=Pelagerythrobacter aerophilus TaxID=2306995 RepID=UPI00160374D7|nr:RNA polymerase sigma factor [Pelagerythrobacter aerophilus]